MTENSPSLPDRDQNKSGADQFIIHANYELFIAGLVFYQLLNSVLWVFLRGKESVQVVMMISIGLSLILLPDAVYRLLKAPKKLVWFGSYFGFLAFIGSLPIPFFALARLLWYRLVVRRIGRSDVRSAADMVVEQRAQSTLLAVLLTALFVLEAGSIAVLAAEAGSTGANIETAGDALWWSIVTIATVGYGDRYPVTPQGRIVGVFMMIVGVGVFSVLTSYLAHTFLRTRKKRVGRRAARPESAQSLQATLEDVKDLLEQHDQAHQESLNTLRSRVAELEEMLANKG